MHLTRQYGVHLACAILFSVAFQSPADAAIRPAHGPDNAPEPAQTDTLALSLGQAVRMAAEHHSTVEAAAFRVDAGAASLAEQRAELWPELSVRMAERGRTFNTAEFGIDFPTVPGEPPLFDPDGQVEGPVYAFDVRAVLEADLIDVSEWRRLSKARAGLDAAKAEVQAVSERAAARAAAAWVAYDRTLSALEALQEDRSLADDLVRIARSRLDAGQGVALDLTRAKARRAAVEAQILGAERIRDQARLDLVQMLGLSPDTDVRLVTFEPAGPDPVPGESTAVYGEAVSRRGDLHAAESRQAVIREEIRAIRAERLPVLSFYADEGILGKTPVYPRNTYNFALQLSIPIFDAGRIHHRVDEQEALLAESSAQLDALREDLRYALTKALLDVSAVGNQVEAARTGVDLAREEVDQARRRFETGVAPNAEVITAALGLSRARAGLISTQTNLEAARIRLAALRGTLTHLP